MAQIDVIPPSQAMAQAANESAWGTSRFATEAINLFGQWCFRKDCGIVSASRTAGSTHGAVGLAQQSRRQSRRQSKQS